VPAATARSGDGPGPADDGKVTLVTRSNKTPANEAMRKLRRLPTPSSGRPLPSGRCSINCRSSPADAANQRNTHRSCRGRPRQNAPVCVAHPAVVTHWCLWRDLPSGENRATRRGPFILALVRLVARRRSLGLSGTRDRDLTTTGY